MRRSLPALLLATGMALAPAAFGQAYPNKPIKIVVTFPAGGGADYVARVIAPKLSDALGQPVLVENRAGANGAIGNEFVAKSPPDGYTLLLAAAGPLTIAPNLYEKQATDPFRDFEPISRVGSSASVLVVNPAVAAHSLADLTALAKANPGRLNFGSSGNGGVPHLAGELYKRMAGVDLVHVPYKGLAPAIADLLGGQVQVLFADVGLIAPYVKAGKLRAIAITGKQRSAMLPDVPTMIEAGLPGYRAGASWWGLLAPAGTPSAIIARLNTEVVKVLSTPEIKSKFAAQGVEPAPTTPKQFAALIREDYDTWAKVIKEAHIKAE